MSQWTHVSAIIRIDSLRGMMPAPEIPSPPSGSEGPLNAHLWINPIANHLAAYTVTVWGDLRDYEDEEEIVRWLNNFTSGKMIRSGIVQIEIEYQRRVTYEHRCDIDEPHFGAWDEIAGTKIVHA